MYLWSKFHRVRSRSAAAASQERNLAGSLGEPAQRRQDASAS